MNTFKSSIVLLAVFSSGYCLPAQSAHAQDTTTVYFNENWKKTTGSDAYYYRKAWKTGKEGLWEVRDYYPTHVLQMSGFTYDPNSDSSEGHTIYYYPSGKRKKECSYLHEKAVGSCQTWYENGQQESTGNYADDKETGEWTGWYENGQMQAKGSYTNGDRTGTWAYWHENGKPSGKGGFVKDLREGNWDFWHDNGKLSAKGSYVKDSLEGTWLIWHENGQLSDSGSYRNGGKTGTWTSWHDNGQMAAKGAFAGGKETGEWNTWHENGRPASTGRYLKGEATGPWKAWYDNGQKDYEAGYVNGKLDSLGTWYYRNGQRSAEEFYAADMLISGKYWNEKGERVTIQHPGLQKPYFKDETNMALLKYLGEHIRYPNEAREKSISGRVVLKFFVDEEGNVTSPSVLTSVDPLLDNEALRVVNGMPKWTPGKMHNRLAKVYFTLPVTFRLE